MSRKVLSLLLTLMVAVSLVLSGCGKESENVGNSGVVKENSVEKPSTDASGSSVTLPNGQLDMEDVVKTVISDVSEEELAEILTTRELVTIGGLNSMTLTKKMVDSFNKSQDKYWVQLHQ